MSTLGTRIAIGLALAAALGLADLVGAFAPPPDLGSAPPWAATLATAIAGGVTLVAVGVAVWAATREGGGRPAQVGRIAVWVAVASRVVSVLVAVPTTFLLGVTVPLVVWSVVALVLTVVAVVLLITGATVEASHDRHPATGRPT